MKLNSWEFRKTKWEFRKISSNSDNIRCFRRHLESNVTTAKIVDANITTAKIAADAVNGTKIADD